MVKLKFFKRQEVLLLITGILISAIFLGIGLEINITLGRGQIPAFDNELSKSFVLLLLGMSFGYNIAISSKHKNKSSYFYTGVLLPISIVAFLGTFFYFVSPLPPFLMFVGFLFPIFAIHSEWDKLYKKFENLLTLFGKYLSNIGLISISISDYLFPLAGIGTDIYSRIFATFLSFVITFISRWLLENDFSGG
ncbi:MAG: hypothetical protein V1648_01980 [Candidatus Aenigmatarchaeota archaeon]